MTTSGTAGDRPSASTGRTSTRLGGCVRVRSVKTLVIMGEGDDVTYSTCECGKRLVTHLLCKWSFPIVCPNPHQVLHYFRLKRDSNKGKVLLTRKWFCPAACFMVGLQDAALNQIQLFQMYQWQIEARCRFPARQWCHGWSCFSSFVWLPSDITNQEWHFSIKNEWAHMQVWIESNIWTMQANGGATHLFFSTLAETIM